MLKSTDLGRTSDQNAFADEDPDFFLEYVGPSHTLILNKYCVVRPQYLLHTNVFVLQSDHLSESDLSAAWNVLSRLESPHMIIYNCGFEAGSSVGHKHIQILPRPPKEEFEFFPDSIGISEGQSCSRKDLFRRFKD
jgi:ATP adenylyltransferase/5',5'''-P-1,P-4-tetraphosphate phosphorylase II